MSISTVPTLPANPLNKELLETVRELVEATDPDGGPVKVKVVEAVAKPAVEASRKGLAGRAGRWGYRETLCLVRLGLRGPVAAGRRPRVQTAQA